MSELGCGYTQAYVFERGGVTQLGELTFTGVEWERVLDDTSNASLDIQGIAGAKGEACCRLLNGVYPWEHELHIYRDKARVWLGAITQINFAKDSAKVSARDLSVWLDKRLLHQSHSYANTDLSTIYQAFFDDAMAPDTSPNFTLSISPCGVTGDRTTWAGAHRNAGHDMGELSRTGIDWTVIKRTMLAGGLVVPTTASAQLWDEHFAEQPNILVDGLSQATRIVTRGGGGGLTGDIIEGEAPSPAWPDIVPPYPALTTAQTQFGLVERVVKEPNIGDVASANVNAQQRLNLLQNSPIVISGGRLNPTAPVDESTLIPGALFNIRLSNACVPVLGNYRVQKVNFKAGGGDETVDITFQPQGTEDSGDV